MSFKKFLNEVTDDQLDDIESKSDLFNNIFGDKQRIIIPLGENLWDGFSKWWERANMHKDKSKIKSDYFAQELKKQGYEVDFEKGIAKSKIRTQQGVKEKIEKIGTVLQRLIKHAPKTPISIIISRSPIDILRMSDHREISSCHSPPGSSNTTSWRSGEFHRCARQEAKTGGAIAYAVLTSDLKNVDLQATEIFKDRDRWVDGIEPLERVRLRRFSDGKKDILLPELKVYGINHVGFLNAVKDWCKKVQNTNNLHYQDFDLRGGSYKDTQANKIWNDFFGTKETKDKETIDIEDEGSWTAERLEITANNMIADHNFKYCSVYAEAQESDGQPYLYFSGGVSFEFSQNLFIRVPNSNEVYHRTGLYEELVNNLELKFPINEISLHNYKNKVSFILDLVPNHQINQDDDHNRPADINQLEHFLDDLDRLERKYDDYYTKFFEILEELELIKKPEQKFQHFKMEENEFISEKMWIGDLLGVSKSELNMMGVFKGALHQNALVIFPFKLLNNGNLYFSLNYEWYNLKDPIDVPCKVFLTLKIPISQNLNKELKIIKHIDNNWNYYLQRGAQWFNNIKPSLLNKPGGGYSPKIKIPPKPKSTQTQLSLDFKEYFYE